MIDFKILIIIFSNCIHGINHATLISAFEKEKQGGLILTISSSFRSKTLFLAKEEIRAEALVRNRGPFAKFLFLAASEAGKLINYTQLSQAIGISHTTIASYFHVLEDCLIVEKIEPISVTIESVVAESILLG